MKPIAEKPEISALVPCLNESENVERLVDELTEVFDSLHASFEILFIDNGSTDGTAGILRKICASNPNVRVIFNTRNFGQMRSPTYGLYQTQGRCVLGISADFQEPTELIPEFIEKWRAGTPIVLGVRRTENSPLLYRIMRRLGYWYLEKFGDYRVIPGATGFGVYDRRVLDCVSQWRDPEPFFRGLLVESGFDILTVPYDRRERAAGRSKNSIFSNISFGIVGLASCSKRLLRFPIYLSVFGLILSGVLFLLAVYSTVSGQDPTGDLFAGFILAGFSIICFFLGLMGEQLRLIAETVRNVPLVVEKERVNFPLDKTRPS